MYEPSTMSHHINFGILMEQKNPSVPHITLGTRFNPLEETLFAYNMS